MVAPSTDTWPASTRCLRRVRERSPKRRASSRSRRSPRSAASTVALSTRSAVTGPSVASAVMGPPEWTRTMRALKVLVVVMGVLLIAGFAVVVVTIMSRMGQRAAVTAPGVAHLAPFGAASVTLPADSLVMEVQGAGDRILLRLDLRDGSEMLLVLDAATGTELGRIKLDHEKSQ